MTPPAFGSHLDPYRQAEDLLRPVSATLFAAAASSDSGLLQLLEAYEAEAMLHAPGLPPLESFGPERLLAFGMTARAWMLTSDQRGQAPAAAALLRAAAGPRLHRRASRYRLRTGGVMQLVALLPLFSNKQSEVVEVLATVGRKPRHIVGELPAKFHSA